MVWNSKISMKLENLYFNIGNQNNWLTIMNKEWKRIYICKIFLSVQFLIMATWQILCSLFKLMSTILRILFKCWWNKKSTKNLSRCEGQFLSTSLYLSFYLSLFISIFLNLWDRDRADTIITFHHHRKLFKDLRGDFYSSPSHFCTEN